MSRGAKRSLDASPEGSDDRDQHDEKRMRSVNPLNGQIFSAQYYTLLKQRRMLPVWEWKDHILQYVSQFAVTLLVGETGSGKTTQIPQFLQELHLPGMIGCTQPRRVAAINVAHRVAEECDVRLGDEVGYVVRFDERRGDKTKLMYLTEGMILRELMADKFLTKYSILMVDEAHERTVESDLLLGFAKEIAKQRADFHLLVSSATLDITKFERYFPDAPTIRVPGRQFNVETYFTTAPVKDYIQSSIDYALHVHESEPPGDILVFLTGEAEIEKAARIFEERALDLKERNPKCLDAKVLRLYGALPIEEQKRVFIATPANSRKVVFTTNIAETSLTIDGITYVVDCGYCKQKLFNPEYRVDALLATCCSKASAKQRAGRAGRTRPGKCFRLYTEASFAKLEEQTFPEIVRTSLSDVVLMMLRLDVRNVVLFDFIDAPSPQSVLDAIMQLGFLDAIDDEMHLTEIGKRMAELPLTATSARMLLCSPKHGCTAEITIIAAMMCAGNAFVKPRSREGEADSAREQFIHPQGDHMTLYTTFCEFARNHCSPQFCYDNFLNYRSMSQASKVHEQLASHLNRLQLPRVSCCDANGKPNADKVLRAVLDGHPTHVAYLPRGYDKYVTPREKVVCFVHKSSSLQGKPQWVVFAELDIQSGEGAAMRTVSPVELPWLVEVAPQYFNVYEIEDPEIAAEIRKVTPIEIK